MDDVLKMLGILTLIAVLLFVIFVLVMGVGHFGGMMGGGSDRHHDMMGSSMHGKAGGMHGSMHGTSRQEENNAPERTEAGDTALTTRSDSADQQVFRIKTVIEGKMAYRGNGEINPTLNMTVDQPVTIHLTNSAGGQHDLVIPELDAATTVLTRQGDTTVHRFVPNKTGQFTYYCSVPGHRRAGMEGDVIVSD